METPLLTAEAPADTSASPPPSPCPAPVDEVGKNTEEAGVSMPSMDCGFKKPAEATDKTAGVSPASKEERRAWFLSWFVGGRGTMKAGEGSSGGNGGAKPGGPVLSSSRTGSGLDVLNNQHVVDIHSAPRTPPPAMTARGGVGAEARKSFPSRVLATLLGRKTREKVNPEILLQRKTQISKLIQRAEDFADLCDDHGRLADPSVNLAAALREFASTENTATVAGLQETAVNLEKIASSLRGLPRSLPRKRPHWQVAGGQATL